ncbi:hypothetical protein ACLOJK_036416, partial [Asimina triloba]
EDAPSEHRNPVLHLPQGATMAAHSQPIVSNPNQIQVATDRQQGMAHLHRTVICTNSGGRLKLWPRQQSPSPVITMATHQNHVRLHQHHGSEIKCQFSSGRKTESASIPIQVDYQRLNPPMASRLHHAPVTAPAPQPAPFHLTSSRHQIFFGQLPPPSKTHSAST